MGKPPGNSAHEIRQNLQYLRRQVPLLALVCLKEFIYRNEVIGHEGFPWIPAFALQTEDFDLLFWFSERVSLRNTQTRRALPEQLSFPDLRLTEHFLQLFRLEHPKGLLKSLNRISSSDQSPPPS